MSNDRPEDPDQSAARVADARARLPVSGTLTMDGRQMALDLDDPHPADGPVLLRVIRGAGPQEGEPMGWCVLDRATGDASFDWDDPPTDRPPTDLKRQ
jgi:hypothetical protein